MRGVTYGVGWRAPTLAQQINRAATLCAMPLNPRSPISDRISDPCRRMLETLASQREIPENPARVDEMLGDPDFLYEVAELSARRAERGGSARSHRHPMIPDPVGRGIVTRRGLQLTRMLTPPGTLAFTLVANW